jgi:AraC-like DNA-binding protein
MLEPNRLLDTSVLAPREREAAAREFLETITDVDVTGHACPPEMIRTRIRSWDLRGLQLNVMDSSWLGFSLNRRSTTEAVSFGVQLSGQTVKTIGERRQVFSTGDISLTDYASPYQWQSADDSTAVSLRFTYAELCLPADQIRSAVGDLAASPLYELFQAHVLDLHRLLEEDVPASAVESLGSAALELARAVIATIGHDDPARNDVANDALMTRVEAYVQQHLTDPALSPESIARAHHISVRQLYKMWSARELSLAEWMIRGRLEGARHDLAKDGSAAIASVARRWGFTDPTHFGRRFRAAYGLSPSEWRQAHKPRSSGAPRLGEIMLLLDTSRYAVEDRAEILRGGLADLAGVELAPVDGDSAMRLRFRAWDIGDGCSILHAQSSGFQFRRVPARDSHDEAPVIGFSMMPAGGAQFGQHDRRDMVPGGGMFIAEMSEAFDCRFAPGSEGLNLMVPLPVLDVPLRDVRVAAEWLPLSPVYSLASRHLLSLLSYTKDFGAPHPSAQRAALHVLRALVRSFGAD